MDYLVVDCETTTFQKGSPYSLPNKLCLVGLINPDGKLFVRDVEYSEHSYSHILKEIQDTILETNLLITFNGKFDLAWLRRYGISFDHCKVWDCQVVDYILSGQTHVFPSLNDVAQSFNLETKLDIVKEQYWNLGIDTPDIPLETLIPYLEQDLYVTHCVFKEQLRAVNMMQPAMKKLISLSNQYLLVLLEMEWNGIKLNFERMKEEAIQVEHQINTLKGELNEYFNDVAPYCLNYSSGDCLSVLLYGGTLTETVREVVGTYKTGSKVGMSRYKLYTIEHVLPRRFNPPQGTSLKKEGFFRTNEETLRTIKASKSQRVILDKLLELSKLEKLNSTYYVGLENKHTLKEQEEDFIHGQFNQVVARTGRLSSSDPNLQNQPPEMDVMIETRF